MSTTEEILLTNAVSFSNVDDGSEQLLEEPGGIISGLISGADFDPLPGDASNDIIVGGSASDLFQGRMQLVNDTFDGGDGIDTVDYGGTAYPDGTRADSPYATVGVTIVLARDGVSSSGIADKYAGVDTGGLGIDVLIGIENANGTDLNDYISGSSASNTLNGRGGNDDLRGLDGDDVLDGGAGDDRLDGGAGDDRLVGGSGADRVYGGDGNDTLHAGEGAPQGRYVRIYHSDGATIMGFTELEVWSGGVNVAAGKGYRAGSDAGSASTFYNSTTALSDGLDKGAAWNGQHGEDSNLAWVGGGIKPYIELDLGSVHAIDDIVLYGRADYTWQQANLRVVVGSTPLAGDYAALAGDADVWRVDTAGPTAGHVVLGYTPQADSFDGGAGIDTLDYSTSLVAERAALGKGVQVNLAAGTADKWYGGDDGGIVIDTLVGIENVIGTAQNDILAGNTQDNEFTGGAGSDTYRFQAGSGTDTIIDTGGGQDTMIFDASSDQLWFMHVGDDLLISVIGTGDQVTVKNWYADAQNQVEVVRAGNGQQLLSTQVDSLVEAMASLAPPSMGQTTLSPTYQSQLAPALAAWSGT